MTGGLVTLPAGLGGDRGGTSGWLGLNMGSGEAVASLTVVALAGAGWF